VILGWRKMPPRFKLEGMKLRFLKSHRFGVFVLVCLLLGLIENGQASIPAKNRQVPRPAGLNEFRSSGAIIGGVAGQPFSLLRAQKLKSPEGVDRLALVYGDSRGDVLKSEPGYFHIQVQENPPRVSIDLAQVQKTAMDAAALAQLFRDSSLVSGTEMTMDPIDLSTNLILNLKKPAEVRAAIEAYQGAQVLVIDVRAKASGKVRE